MNLIDDDGLDMAVLVDRWRLYQFISPKTGQKNWVKKITGYNKKGKRKKKIICRRIPECNYLFS